MLRAGRRRAVGTGGGKVARIPTGAEEETRPQSRAREAGDVVALHGGGRVRRPGGVAVGATLATGDSREPTCNPLLREHRSHLRESREHTEGSPVSAATLRTRRPAPAGMLQPFGRRV